MGVEVGIWRIDGGLSRLASVPMPKEAQLESVLEEDISILGLDLMLIGRQVTTSFGKRIDLLAIDTDGNLAVVELKRDRTPREIVAQVLDYGSWLATLGFDDVVDLYAGHAPGSSFEAEFSRRFNVDLPESINVSHSLVIVAAELDASTERIVGYLSEQHGVPINVVFFRYFIDDGREYLARSWLREPEEVENKARIANPTRRKEQPWNGNDYYVSFGADESRSWEDARKYGYVCGGGGVWYSRSLKTLEVGKRVFVCIPSQGYVGVGEVKQAAVMAKDFVPDGFSESLLALPLEQPAIGTNLDDPETAEWVVGVKWTVTVPVTEAFWQQGMFANQNTACRMRSQFTIDELTEHWHLDS